MYLVQVVRLNAQMVTHAVNYVVVNGDVVLYQMLFVVQIMNIVARKELHVICQQRRVPNMVKSQIVS
jgi:hypothetical protein